MNYQNILFLFLGVPIRSTRLVTQISTFVCFWLLPSLFLPPHLIDFCALAWQ
ncbi:hypothetical protein [Mesorhizobium sp.]|uniref:hypothetical protein n=1 Tax=Mesorhizobium sp. TaxID=1871066 RepID=UPI00257AB579|nr:hypothetical protein [Mesorhizobium sp.]